MEFVVPKLSRSRTQRRQKRLIKNRRRNQRRKLEVNSSKRHKTKRSSKNHGLLLTQPNVNFRTMTADAFWANYKVAHDWQHRHNVAWWKSRCIALEYENNVLKDKIREQAATYANYTDQTRNYSTQNYRNYHQINEEENEYEPAAEENEEQDNETLEFQVDEEMLKFLEQSVRHKMELKRMRESENEESNHEGDNPLKIESGESIVNRRIENAKQLYGAASSRILSMETALQMTIDQHRDSGKPHYWPNIPLNP